MVDFFSLVRPGYWRAGRRPSTSEGRGGSRGGQRRKAASAIYAGSRASSTSRPGALCAISSPIGFPRHVFSLTTGANHPRKTADIDVHIGPNRTAPQRPRRSAERSKAFIQVFEQSPSPTWMNAETAARSAPSHYFTGARFLRCGFMPSLASMNSAKPCSLASNPS
jgi:hypothetical protein